MSAWLDAAAKEAREGNFELMKRVRRIGNVFSNCVEVSAQEAAYPALQIPLIKCTKDIVFINTSAPEERIFLLKPKSVLDELLKNPQIKNQIIYFSGIHANRTTVLYVFSHDRS